MKMQTTLIVRLENFLRDVIPSGAPRGAKVARRGVEGPGAIFVRPAQQGNINLRGVAARDFIRVPRLRCARLAACAALGMTILFSASVWAADEAKSYESFRLVRTRNIFDPDRRATRTEAPRSAPRMTTRANFINLTGTMVADGKTLAFFSGSRAEYSKVISIGDSVADFKVTGITNTQVELDHGGKAIVVAVGKQIPLEGSSAAMSTVPVEETPAEAPPGDAPAPNPAAPGEAKPASAPAAPDGGTNDVLRQMMERRAKEMSK